jgi:alkylation response protein AidB-like acyl-CoA dehydrogenase
VPSALLRDGEGRPFAVVPDRTLRVDHADLFDEWRIASLQGGSGTAASGGHRLASRLGPFVGDLTMAADAPHEARDLQVHLALSAWGVLGTVDRAVELAVEHVKGRIQFGKPISSFQSVQFQLADSAVAVAGLRELAAFTLWRLDAAPGAALADVLALRVHAIDVARAVLRTCQQLHGAAGVCDEYDVSVLARMVQPALRLPWSAERTAEALADAIAGDGFEGLFEHGLAR